MIRKTIAKAFGRSADGDPVPLPPPMNRGDAMPNRIHQTFRELQIAFEREVRTRARSVEGDPVWKFLPAKSRPEGLEFGIRTPAGRYHFLNTMTGVCWILKEEAGEDPPLRPVSVLSLHPDRDGIPRLIVKPVGGLRASFRFTSVREVVQEILQGVTSR